jgi:glycosyltransferase involved in cell wall biosynthesis
MRIVFIDPASWQYTVETPYEHPVGGSQSALCYLAIELARLGHSITILNGSTAASESRGVKIANIITELDSPKFPASVDVGIVLNSAIAHRLRRDLRLPIPLVLWNQHAHDQQAIQELRRLREREAWNGFAFVSEWQRQKFERIFKVPAEKSRVMRNAASPAFAECTTTTPWFAAGDTPVLFYTSTPFRGLDVLLSAFPKIRASVPDTRLRIYSSMRVYQVPSEADQYRFLYDSARSIDGVEYIGSVGQERLARELGGAAALAYPSTFAETSCIAAIEAMAAGAAVFTTRLGALPETTEGHAAMVDWQPDKAELAENFAAMVVQALRDMRKNPEAAKSRREQRLEFIRKNYLWPDRAKQWVEWLTQVVREAEPVQK